MSELRARDDTIFPELLQRLGERSCLPGGLLEGLVLGSPSPAEATAAHTHLIDCLSCLNTFARLQSLHEGPQPRPRLVQDTPSARALRSELSRLAAMDEERGGARPPVLITGEAGTGKGVVAREIHALSRRASRPFLEIGCAATPASWLEIELFGYEQGAFPDATAAMPGVFEAAEGGTVFLDEIEALPLDLQGRLLMALESRSVRRVGAPKATPHDIRVIVATHVDLGEAVRRGAFRADLLERFQLSRVDLRPLRERPDDIVPLARYFVDQFARHLGETPRLTMDAEERLRRYRWPGNVRELSEVIERVARRGAREDIGADELDLPRA
jgi:DNA-binding NtrC family response regulator